MSTDRAEAAVETEIAKHVANSFRPSSRDGRREATAAQIRSRITDRFQPAELHIEQDNQPPALVALHRRIIAAFSPIERNHDASDRSSRLSDLRDALERRRHVQSAMPQKSMLEHAKSRLLIERQQLLVKNEFTEGFGRVEAWVLSIAFLALVLLEAVSILWALPILALSICRSWQLDRQCKRRLKKISEIDALIDRIELAP